MGKLAKLTLVEPEPSNPARVALDAAIARAGDASEILAATKAAIERAKHNKWDAQTALEAVQAKTPGNEVDSAAFVQQVLTGDAASVGKALKPGADRRGEEQAAAALVDTWASAQETCEAQLPEQEKELGRAGDAVDRALKAYVASRVDVGQILDGLDDQLADVIRRRAQLQYLWTKGLLAPEDALRARDHLNGSFYLPTATMSPPGCEAPQRMWVEAIERLRTDPDAPLPTDKAAAQ